MRTATKATLDQAAAPDVAAKVWDDYLHLFGASAYILARYTSTLPTLPTTEGSPDVGASSREDKR